MKRIALAALALASLPLTGCATPASTDASPTASPPRETGERVPAANHDPNGPVTQPER